MNISLTPELESIIEDKVKSGMYHSASEVVREALRLLREHEEVKEMRLRSLKADLLAGLEQAKTGNTLTEEEVLSRLKTRQTKRAGKK